MDVTFEEHGPATVARISGSVDGLTAETLQGALRAQIEGGRVRMVADLAEVDYTSSAGLRALLATLKATRQQGGDLRIAAAQPNVLKVLELSGFTSILKLYADVPAAVASFGDAA